MLNEVLKQSIDYSVLKSKQYVKGNKIKFGSGLIALSLISLLYGLIIWVFFEAPNIPGATTGPIDYGIYRSYFVDFILVVYLTLFCFSFVSSFVGMGNPFVNSRVDLQFQILIPINPLVSYLSTKFYLLTRNLLICSIGTIFLFGPLMIALNRNTASIRILFVILLLLLGFEINSQIGNIIFLLLQRIRAGKNWAVTYTEKPIFGKISLVIVPGKFIGLFYQQ